MLLAGKKALIFGVANNKSIAYGISKEFKDHGAQLAFSYVGEAIQKRVEPICQELGGDFTFPCDVTDDAQVAAAAEMVREKWGTVDVIVHSVAFAHRDDLHGRYIDTTRDGFKLALDVSAYSLVALCKAFEPLLNPAAAKPARRNLSQASWRPRNGTRACCATRRSSNWTRRAISPSSSSGPQRQPWTRTWPRQSCWPFALLRPRYSKAPPTCDCGGW